LKNDAGNPPPPIRIYQQIMPTPAAAQMALLAKFRVYLPDRPGSLAGFASAVADAGGNISFFHYDRAADSSRVVVEVQQKSERDLSALLASLREKQYGSGRAGPAQDDVLVTAVENILEVKVRLKNEPGTLAAFARLLAGHDANVIYMLYDEDIDPGSADIAMVTTDPQEINVLMRAMNEKGYLYRIVYRGSDAQEAANVIGLNMVEKFFFRLKKLLPTSDVAEIKSLVESSKDLYQDLVQFYTEAGNNLEAGDVFETVLTFASRSRSRTGEKFSAAAMRPLGFPGGVTLLGFRLPTTENVYVLKNGDDLTLIDTGHGIYYDDLKDLIRKYGMDPAKVRRIYITHPDTDHAGAAGYFEREFNAEVFMHPGSAAVMMLGNRAAGAAHPGLLNLNKYYTRLSSAFTECRFPSRPHYFADAETGRAGAFGIIGRFGVGPLAFEVLKSRGGHTPGLVFYLNREFGLLFTSDFLLNIKSLSAEDKEHLGIYRYLLTSPNSDNRIYQEETAALKELMLAVNDELSARKRAAFILPGHGEYYRAEELNRS
jgi:glyoxylase-like metal-dependent hydrolase (beta-lactamase superfamily II)